jgi:phosphoenolpyruvate phosphomutase
MTFQLPTSKSVRKTTQFRNLLQSPELECILEAHNGLSARIVEEAGFPGIWASGLCLSAQFGVRDSNEASWTQILDVLEFMSDATTVPILLDGDTGYGNFNNMRRLVRKLEQRQIAAVCIEDKLFPKTNSFIAGETQPLADIEEFCGKIKAGKDAQLDPDFSVIARTEALIAGRGMDEALRRAEAYHEAGADAILIHSSRQTADEVLAFRAEWGDRCPVVLVPTRYHGTPTDVFREAGFSLAIWANHLLRSSLLAMQRTARILKREARLSAVENHIAPLSEVFRLQGVDELKQAETRFLPETHPGPRAIVLAASRGKALGELTADRPKAMVKVEGEPLLAHIVTAYGGVQVRDITVVRGYRKESVELPGITTVDNDEYETTGELYSLHLALEKLEDTETDLFVSYGDVLFHRGVLDQMLSADGDFVIPVDPNWRESANLGRHADFVACPPPPSRRPYSKTVELVRVAADVPETERGGEWMGLLRVSPRGLPVLRGAVDRMIEEVGSRAADMGMLLSSLVESGHTVRVVYSTGNWIDVDELHDIVDAESFQ